jgi:hypothetical protein
VFVREAVRDIQCERLFNTIAVDVDVVTTIFA